MSGDLKNILEAVLLASDAPLGVARLQGLFARDSQPGADAVKQAIAELQAECDGRGVELRKIGGGYRYQSRPRYAEWIRKLHAARPPRLSRALLETLAIIAYRQPVTRGDIEEIRGVGVSPDIMRRLAERGWVAEVGARDVPGRPALFATTREFLSYFNLESLKELPPLSAEREFGQVAAELDAPLPPELLAALRDSAAAAGRPEIPADDDGGDDGDGDGDDGGGPSRHPRKPPLRHPRNPLSGGDDGDSGDSGARARLTERGRGSDGGHPRSPPLRHPRSPLSGGDDGDSGDSGTRARLTERGRGSDGGHPRSPLHRHPRSPLSGGGPSRHPRSQLSGGGDGNGDGGDGDGETAADFDSTESNPPRGDA